VFKVAKMETVGQMFMTRWDYVADPLIFAVNPRVWNDFSAEDQQILREAAAEAGKVGIAASRNGDDEAVKEITALGVKVTVLTEAERQKFVEATRGVYADWSKKIGEDLVRLAEQAVANR
jgi:TRAP-type C4-dicarboxylate transport system substrate-binding protein